MRASDVLVLDLHEIVAGKLVALVDRNAARDLFDARRILSIAQLDWSLHRLMVCGSDRSALQWRRDQAIDGTEALALQHLYRAMGWLGEALGEREPDAPSPRRVKGLIEEELFARRRDLLSALDLVFFDTTSLFFTGNGGDTLGQYGKSKDHRSDCKQMVLAMVIVVSRNVSAKVGPSVPDYSVSRISVDRD